MCDVLDDLDNRSACFCERKSAGAVCQVSGLPAGLIKRAYSCTVLSCGAIDTKVIDSRLVSEGNHVRRRRECITCEERFTTYESAELVMPRIIKQNGIREPFNEDKLFAGLNKALEKRPSALKALKRRSIGSKRNLRSTGEREIPPDSR